jgi:hypothetical protein
MLIFRCTPLKLGELFYELIFDLIFLFPKLYCPLNGMGCYSLTDASFMLYMMFFSNEISAYLLGLSN